MRITGLRVLRVFGWALAVGLAFGLLAQLHWFYQVHSSMELLPPDTPTLSQYILQTWTLPAFVAVFFAVFGTIIYFAYFWLKERSGR